jgi:hypothetical protein
MRGSHRDTFRQMQQVSFDMRRFMVLCAYFLDKYGTQTIDTRAMAKIAMEGWEIKVDDGELTNQIVISVIKPEPKFRVTIEEG